VLATAHNRTIRAQDPSHPAALHIGAYSAFGVPLDIYYDDGSLKVCGAGLARDTN
jgi:hypothetical protein